MLPRIYSPWLGGHVQGIPTTEPLGQPESLMQLVTELTFLQDAEPPVRGRRWGGWEEEHGWLAGLSKSQYHPLPACWHTCSIHSRLLLTVAFAFYYCVTSCCRLSGLQPYTFITTHFLWVGSPSAALLDFAAPTTPCPRRGSGCSQDISEAAFSPGGSAAPWGCSWLSEALLGRGGPCSSPLQALGCSKLRVPREESSVS